MENKYKKGDWVRAKKDEENIARGEVLRVRDAARPTPIGAWVSIEGKRSSADDGSYLESRFEPWRPKVGERVRVVYGHGWDGEGEVTIANDRLFTVRLKTGESAGCEGGFFLPDLEPVTDTLPVAEQPTALLITAGRFYKTRDGRKVGPMRASTRADWPFIANVEGESDAWYMADGTCPYIPHDDLIAEWVDTPVRDITAATVDAINDEYGPVVREVPVAEQPVRFRVGDVAEVVRCRPGLASHVGKRITIARVSGERLYAPCSGCEEIVFYADELEPAGPFLITNAIVALIENGQPLPAMRPAVHATVEAADAEAKRLANLHTGQTFGVYALTGTPHKEAKVYEHEWQRLAAGGEKIRAVVSLRNMASVDIQTAKRAVEVFIEMAA